MMLSVLTSLQKKWVEAAVLSTQHLQSSISAEKKEKDGKEVVGNIIKAKTHKSRLSKENKEVEIRLYYDERGLDRYYGLLELGEKHGVFKRKGNRIVVGESSVYPSAILADPDKYFTEEVMQLLEEAANEEFSYGE